MKTANEETAPTPPPTLVVSDIYPMDETYATRGELAPIADRIDGAEVPEPYKSLLVHKSDMTSTLEKFYGEKLHVAVLWRDVRENEYCREVALMLDRSKKPVEYGAIKIFLDQFPAAARQEILAEDLPLGRILNRYNMAFVSRPRAFLRLTSDKIIDHALRLQWPQLLYGRSNSLLDDQGRPLAEIVEILPP